MQGDTVRAPFDGLVQPHRPGCVIYSSPEVPAYVFRICGLSQSEVGPITAAKPLGRGQTVQFAALRRQPDGTWAIVEPAVDVLEQMVE
ncbi:hypothetical protein XM38_022320 [Halomicronema hongdechloris C2206]|uniref:Uncharacterized protein n=1 Tax=Halomicronema hongdechloris C2206 TaxID=1641165 RepID=A0A1Z3HLV9_9CYAN|nr:hypothetical protein [Halomicronema hongdechloris]ASC71280.1 hypothetical protein XM38_022320 [Halomicronema hongdechloris C2206]